MKRQIAYAANPTASRTRTIFPHDSSAMVASAPLRLVAFPPWPTATPIASTATSPYETPFATSPARAAPAYHPLPLSAFACVLSSLRRTTSSPRPTVDTCPPWLQRSCKRERRRPSWRYAIGLPGGELARVGEAQVVTVRHRGPPTEGPDAAGVARSTARLAAITAADRVALLARQALELGGVGDVLDPAVVDQRN